MNKQYVINLLKEAIAELEETETKTNLRDKIVKIAKKYIGRKYVYGGKNIETGVDCSGFTQIVYKEAGVKGIPNDWVNSTGQREWGKEVKSPQLDNARPGDLICYSGHVAIYIGNDEIIDAGNSVKGVSQRSAFISKILTIRNVIGD